MSCPAWEKCRKRSCIEQEVCEVIARSPFALNQHLKMMDRRRKKEALKKAGCQNKGGHCDKMDTCQFLGQCIFTVSAVEGNKVLIKALSGKKSMKQVIDVLAKHNPKPMRSYYLHSKKKK